VAAPGWDRLPADLRAEVSDELNCGELLALGATAGDLVDVSVKANFRTLGKRFGKGTPPVAQAIADADAAELVAALRSAGSVTVVVDGADVELGEDDVLVTETPRAGWAVASDGGETVALDLALTPALRRAGLARETVRLVQEARKTAGFAVSDRITFAWTTTDGELGEALREHGQSVADEVLATSFTEGEPTVATTVDGDDPDLGLRWWITRAAAR
jgi:isoleucyl-tRNA synthetase